MSKYLVYVLVPYSIPYAEINPHVIAKLEPYRLTEDRWGWFDYLCRLEGRDPFSDTETESQIPEQIRQSLQGHICDISKLKEAQRPLALVALEGKWHGAEVNHDEYRNSEGRLRAEFADAVKVARETWPHRYAELLCVSPPCRVWATWAHS